MSNKTKGWLYMSPLILTILSLIGYGLYINNKTALEITYAIGVLSIIGLFARGLQLVYSFTTDPQEGNPDD